MPYFSFASLILVNLLQRNASPLDIFFSSCLLKFFVKPILYEEGALIHLGGQQQGPL